MSTKETKKITLNASNGVLRDFIHDVIWEENLKMFEKKFNANILETKIIFTEKDKFTVLPDDWERLISYIKDKTSLLNVFVCIE